ncbi:MAG: hypothetical protein CRN43_21300 [Candidatus Nephrothrix sp. EaCA]|nr:MAG: hypothetical protein CRN43_21300 [Candidatus Nephrothrix sp. EaCA]
MVVRIFGLKNRNFFRLESKIYATRFTTLQTSNQIDAADRIKSQKRQAAGFGPLCHNNNNNNYDNLYGAVMRPYRYKGALQATTLGRP